MVVVCDTYDWTDYPAYIYPSEDVRTEAKKYDNVNMQKIMEVYDLNKSKEAQIWGGKKVFNY